MIARFLEKAIALDISLLPLHSAKEVIRKDGRIVGVRTNRGEIAARYGVVLATGGFSGNPSLREQFFPQGTYSNGSHTLAVPAAAGDGAQLAVAAGAVINSNMAQPTTWLPMSQFRDAHGKYHLFPHLFDRNKPGFITVNRYGYRFANEFLSYQDYTPLIIAELSKTNCDHVCLVCDAKARRKYGIGMVKPLPFSDRKWLRNTYLIRGSDIEDLAAQTGVDGPILRASIESFNADAEKGLDTAFHRGTTAYQQATGDFRHHPNPSVGPLTQAPYYALKLIPGDIGTSIGIATDADGRALDAYDKVIPGLYIAGNDMANPTAGVYPGGGATLGPGMTFAYRAAMHIVGNIDDSPLRVDM